MQIFDADSGALLETFQPTAFVTLSADWSSNGLIATADNEDHVVVYDADSLDVLYELGASGSAFHMTFSPDGSRLAGCHEGGNFDLWAMDDGTFVASGPTGLQDCFATAWSPDGSILYVGGSDMSDKGLIVAYDARTGDRIGAVEVTKMVWAISPSPDGQFLALALDNGDMVVAGIP